MGNAIGKKHQRQLAMHKNEQTPNKAELVQAAVNISITIGAFTQTQGGIIIYHWLQEFSYGTISSYSKEALYRNLVGVGYLRAVAK